MMRGTRGDGRGGADAGARAGADGRPAEGVACGGRETARGDSKMGGGREGAGVAGLSIGRNMLWNSAGSLTSLGCQWLITVLIVRLSSGYDAAGVYSLAMAVYGIFLNVAQYRMYTYQISDVRGENTLGEYYTFRLITCAAALALTMAYAVATCRPGTWLAIFLYGAYRSAALVIDVFHATDQQIHRMDYIGKSLMLQGFASLGLFVAVFTATRSLEATLTAMTAGIVAIHFAYDRRRTCAAVPLQLGIAPDKVRRLLLGCLPIVLAGVACAAAPSLPRQYLSATQGDAALGAYAAVAAPVAIIQMGVSYIYNPLLGYFAESYEARDGARFSRLMRATLLGAAGVAAACAVGLELFGGPLLSLVYGARILPYLYLLVPLVLCAVLTGLMWFVNDLLIALRNFRSTFIGSAAALAASAVSTVPSIALLGLNGVTAATALACAVSIAIMACFLVPQVRGRFAGKL